MKLICLLREILPCCLSLNPNSQLRQDPEQHPSKYMGGYGLHSLVLIALMFLSSALKPNKFAMH